HSRRTVSLRFLSATTPIRYARTGVRGERALTVARPSAARVAFAHPRIMAATRVVAAVFVYQVVLFTLTVVLFWLGVAVVPRLGQSAFALVGLAVAEAAALSSVL